MGAIASQIASLTIVFSTVYLDTDQRKYRSYASLAFVREIHRGPVNPPHKWPVMRKMFPFDDVIMIVVVLAPVNSHGNFQAPVHAVKQAGEENWVLNKWITRIHRTMITYPRAKKEEENKIVCIFCGE